LLDRRPRTAHARAVTDLKLLVLPVEQFAACTLAVPDLKARLRRHKSEAIR
jgi:CRP-like cAMP-binding protein